MAEFELVFYAAPTAIRDDLRAEGITPDGDDARIWLYDNEPLALRQARILGESWYATPEGVADVWRVDLSGFDAEHHPHVNDGQNVSVIADVLAPDRITLQQTL